MIDFNHSVPQKASTAVLEAQILISGRLICFSVIFKITSINWDLAVLAEKITNVPAVFPNRKSSTVKIVIVFLQNCYCLSFVSLIVLPSQHLYEPSPSLGCQRHLNVTHYGMKVHINVHIKACTDRGISSASPP